MNEEKQYDEYGRVIRKNRSAEKREREKIKDFARELLGLPASQYALLPLPAELARALSEGKRLEGNALKRHLNYLTRLLEPLDLEALQEAHRCVNHPFLNTTEKQQRIGREIEKLLSDAPQGLAELMRRYRDLDVQHVRQLVREIHKYRQAQATLPEEARSKGMGKHQKQLQKYLKNLALNETA